MTNLYSIWLSGLVNIAYKWRYVKQELPLFSMIKAKVCYLIICLIYCRKAVQTGSKRMEYDKFTQQLKALGIKKAEFMRYVGMGNSTISAWSKQGRVPRWVEAYLDLLLKAKAMLPDLSQCKASSDQDEGGTNE